jgi:hypothetical protein
MQMDRDVVTVEDILDLYRNGMLRANPEYQRGAVWSKAQQKKLIDSILRSYPIPLIYLHHIKKTVAGMQREDLEIIDGQQRIRAMYQFSEGAFPLFDPVKDDREAKFPNFIKNVPCPWGRQTFEALSDEHREDFKKTKLAVVKITGTDNEARDLFIRLQAGLPLNHQETRDAWPGHFTDFVLRLGGKPDLARYPGHGFFKRVLRMKPQTDRGKTRQLAAQIAILFLTRRWHGVEAFSDVNAKAIDDFYYQHIDFEHGVPDGDRLWSILTKLDDLLGDKKRPKMRGHEAMHLVLLLDNLWDGYTRGWEAHLPEARDRFAMKLAEAASKKDTANPGEFWTRYGQWTRSNSDRADRIRLRHAFYVEKMIEYLAPLQPKDGRRGYGDVEREYIYFRDRKVCAVCQAEAAWDDAEIHHVHEHGRGGQTTLANGVLVHQKCHPRGEAAVGFARDFLKDRSVGPDGAGG